MSEENEKLVRIFTWITMTFIFIGVIAIQESGWGGGLALLVLAGLVGFAVLWFIIKLLAVIGEILRGGDD